jgi:hypothetical protein
MNVIVSNERKNELNSLSIDIIKSVEGVYTVDELIGMFTNFFFNKMILDVTSIKDYSDYSNLKKLFESIDSKKIILYLNQYHVNIFYPMIIQIMKVIMIQMNQIMYLQLISNSNYVNVNVNLKLIHLHILTILNIIIN